MPLLSPDGGQMERRQQVVLSAELAGTAGALPSYCVRHGRYAVRRKDFVLQSRAKLEGSRFMSANALDVAGRLGEKARRTRFVRVRGWPLCEVCVGSVPRLVQRRVTDDEKL